VLAHQARLGPAGADTLDAEGRAGRERERERRPQDLAAALAPRAVDRQHGIIPSRTPDAGRTLFSVSRQRRTTSNDADRLRKYLARFGLTWVGLVERRAGD
jgi:sigma54-dependent transcription regulator